MRFAFKKPCEVSFSQRIEWWLQRRQKKFLQELRSQKAIIREIPDSIARHAQTKRVRITLNGDTPVAEPHFSA